LDNETQNNIAKLIKKLDDVRQEQFEVEAKLDKKEVYNISNTVIKGLKEEIDQQFEDERIDVADATKALKSETEKLKREADEFKKYKRWFMTAIASFVIFGAVLLIFTTLADMPFLTHAYQFIHHKIDASNAWYFTLVWYLAYLLTPAVWIAVIGGASYYVLRRFFDVV
jgi:cation transport ATPase